jgi:NADH:ubiquinone oxidoreductase subunit 6 (subunit J)
MTFNLCDYKDIFGKPNEGVHKYRIYNIAVVDLVLTIIFAYVIAILLNKKFIPTLIVIFLIGCVMHYIFCVDTTINKSINIFIKKYL